jgi:hypothetical protein
VSKLRPGFLAQRELIAPHVEVFIETGTHTGIRCRNLRNLFPELHTIELNQELHREASLLLAPHKHVTCHLGSSGEVLPTIIDPAKRTLFYLDAHFVSTDPRCAGQRQHQCPLLGELDAICRVPWQVLPVILIDDAQFFWEWAWRRGWGTHGYDRSQFPRVADILTRASGLGLQEIATGKPMILLEPSPRWRKP